MTNPEYELRLDYWTSIMLFIKKYRDDERTKTRQLTSAEISKELKLSYSHVIRILMTLEQHKLITIERQPQKRGVNIFMTKAGDATSEAIRVIQTQIGKDLAGLQA